jgi:hypothetical protein
VENAAQAMIVKTYIEMEGRNEHAYETVVGSVGIHFA